MNIVTYSARNLNKDKLRNDEPTVVDDSATISANFSSIFVKLVDL